MSRVLLWVKRNIFYSFKLATCRKYKEDSEMMKRIARTLRVKLRIRNNRLLFLTGRQLLRNYAIIISSNKLFVLHTSNLYTGFCLYLIQLYFIFVSSLCCKLFRGHESSSESNFMNLNKKERTIHWMKTLKFHGRKQFDSSELSAAVIIKKI